MLKIAIDNSGCQKNVANIRFELKRTITAYAQTIEDQKKEFKDEQGVMRGQFEDQVAAKEPIKVARDYAILMKKLRDTDREKNRYFMNFDFETGNRFHSSSLKMQKEVLPSINTPNIQIVYEIVASVSHQGMMGASQDVPELIFPIHITLDP